ncbi:MAG TPA: SIMPL domain-containing protein [Armatimonadota bacterium]|jgi:hypothetical protein
MTRGNLLALSGLLAFGLLAPAARAQDAERRQPPLIEVQGETEVTADPDMATFNVAVVVKDPSAQAAMDKMAAQMEKVIAGLRDQGVARDQMKTSQLSLGEYMEPIPQPENEPARPPRYVKGYQATHRLDVKLNADQFKKIGAMLNAATEAGANEVGSVSFGVKDEAALRAKGLEAAVRSARSKAEAIARGAGVSITGVYRITEGDRGPRPMYEGRDVAMFATKAMPQPVAPSEITRQVTVSAQFLFNK